MASEGGTDDAKRRGDAFARAFSAHLARYISQCTLILLYKCTLILLIKPLMLEIPSSVMLVMMISAFTLLG